MWCPVKKQKSAGQAENVDNMLTSYVYQSVNNWGKIYSAIGVLFWQQIVDSYTVTFGKILCGGLSYWEAN